MVQAALGGAAASFTSRKLIWVYADLGGTQIRFLGARWFYGNKSVRDRIGIEILADQDIGVGTGLGGRRQLHDDSQKMKQYLVRLTAVLHYNFGPGVNATQSGARKRFNFYCDPGYTEEAILRLPGNKIDPNLLPGDWSVHKVYRKMIISRA
jgi:hypothetical protein